LFFNEKKVLSYRGFFVDKNLTKPSNAFLNAKKLHLRRGGGARLVNLVLRSPLQEPAISGDFPLRSGAGLFAAEAV
jgi:hypothetical protein